jgi:hypothetical protein
MKTMNSRSEPDQIAAYQDAVRQHDVPAGELEVYDSCSWLRVGTKGKYKAVMQPVVASDGHPDIAGRNVLRALVAAFNAMPVALAEIARLRQEEEFSAELTQRQSDLLTGVVNALKGPPPAGTLWSHHDAPMLAQALMHELGLWRAGKTQSNGHPLSTSGAVRLISDVMADQGQQIERQAGTIKSLCDRLDRINNICYGAHFSARKVKLIEELSGGFAKVPT